MRPVQQNINKQQRSRGRGRGKPHSGGSSGTSGNMGGNAGGVVNLNRTLDSNGPDVKIRGTVAHICEKYQNLARDANSQGDHVGAENYLQHAEHYYRLLAAANQAQAATREREQVRTNGNASRRLASHDHDQEHNEQGQEPVYERSETDTSPESSLEENAVSQA